jgi:hypothetical protein
MIRTEQGFSKDPQQFSPQEDDPRSRLIELQAENARLQRIVTELLIRNQQLRERASATAEIHVSA